MEKSVIYIAGAFAIVVIVCALAVPSSTTTTDTQTTQAVTGQNIIIEPSTVTTNIWDYIRSKNTTTIGDSDGDTAQTDEPNLTIVIE